MRLFILTSFMLFVHIGFSQDQIVLINGDEIFCKIISVNPFDIIYKKTDAKVDSISGVLRSNVLFVKYQDGSKIVINKAELDSNYSYKFNARNYKRKYNAIFFDAGGNALVASFNYERRFYVNNHDFATLKLGIAPLVAFNTANITSTINLGNGSEYFEMGLGGGLAYGNFLSNDKSIHENAYTFYYFTPTIGFRKLYRKGFLLRMYATTFVNRTTARDLSTIDQKTGTYGQEVKLTYYPFVGISLGYSF